MSFKQKFIELKISSNSFAHSILIFQKLINLLISTLHVFQFVVSYADKDLVIFE